MFASSRAVYKRVQQAHERWTVNAIGFCAAVGAGSFLYRQRRPAFCCGIVAYVGPQEVEPILVEGVRILQNRGYDSCGISTINEEGELVTTKFASKGSTCDCIDLLASATASRHKGHRIGIAHTRWATHGGKTDLNAHPHSDYLNRISLVHNGTIENYNVLKQDLQEKGITFQSETDTEVIANLIGWHLDQGRNLESSVTAAVESLNGTWGLAVIHKDINDQIICARNGSPLLVGCTENEVFVASETAALARHTNQFISLKDGEICVLSHHGIDQLKATRAMQQIHIENVEVSPAPYEHWTIKEISEQPQSLARALNYGGRISPIGNRVKLGGLDTNREALMEIDHLVLSACGTSLYAAMYGERLIQYLGGFESVRSIDASEMEANCLPSKGGGLLLLSQSGETLDTIKACQVGESKNVRLMSVVNVVGSLLARMTNCGVYLNAGREVAVASTKAFTSQVTVLALIATWFAQQKDSPHIDRCTMLMDAVHRVPVYAGMTLDCRKQCKVIAEKIKTASTLFVLGKGFSFPVALEAALKIKEISYVHAEGFAGGALKHGPFALLDEKARTPVILIVPSDEHVAIMTNAAEQIKARGAHLIVITDHPTMLAKLADDVVVVPPNGPLTALMCAVPLQLIAYELAIARGLNPDKPRGLAKTVTVS